jgi:hypothetical protein
MVRKALKTFAQKSELPMRNAKNILIASLLAVCAGGTAVAGDHSGMEPLENADNCTSESECVAAPSACPGCWHFCEGKECDGVRECPPLSRLFKNYPSCVISNPCRVSEHPYKCVNGKCIIARDEHIHR